jgi:hypothetical protein
MGLLEIRDNTDLKRSGEMLPAEPLWKRAPARDAQGRPVSDFMMIIPKLGKKPPLHIKTTLSQIDGVLQCYRHVVLFADINLKLNTLWITVKPVPGICLELAAAIKVSVPEALLVAHKQE